MVLFVLFLRKHLRLLCSLLCYLFRSSHQRCSVRKVILRNFAKFAGKHLCQSLFLTKLLAACNFITKETLAQVFSCEFCEISKNTFFTEHLWVTASVCSCRKSFKLSLKRKNSQKQLFTDVLQNRCS